MTAQALLLAQARNNAWANATLHEAIRELPEEVFLATYPSFFGSLPRTLNQIYQVDVFYVDAMMAGGRGRSVFADDDILNRADLFAAQSATDARLIDHCTTVTPADLHTQINLQRAHGATTERHDHLLLHLFQHQVHHRGQVHAMLSQAGASPPQLDDFFLKFGRVESARRYWKDDDQTT